MDLVLIAVMWNQPVAGSIMVNACNVSIWLLGCLNEYEPMRSMQSVSHGLTSASLAGRCPYLAFRLLVHWYLGFYGFLMFWFISVFIFLIFSVFKFVWFFLSFHFFLILFFWYFFLCFWFYSYFFGLFFSGFQFFRFWGSWSYSVWGF